MKAVVIKKNGPPSVLNYTDIPDLEPGKNDVLIRVAAISIEGGDLLLRRSLPPKSTRRVIGYQAADTLAAVGEGVETANVGQRMRGRRQLSDRGIPAASTT